MALSTEKSGAPRRRPFAVPVCREDALARRDEVIARTKDIDAQLARGRQQKNAMGQLMSESEFRTWRSGAIVAKNRLDSEARFLKLWMRDNYEHIQELLQAV